MASKYILNIPTQFYSGDRVSWWEHPHGDPTTDILSCFIVGLENNLRLTAFGSSDGWEFNLPTEKSKTLLPGKYKAQLILYSGGDRKVIAQGNFTVLASFEDLTSLDPKSDDEKELELITKAIATVVSGGVSEYQIGTRRVRYSDLSELTKRQAYLRRRIAIKNGTNLKSVSIRFSAD